MYKYCATEESARRQRQLEQSLLQLMLAESYAQITVADICDRVGITRKSFYRYFSSKEGCLCALIDHAIFDGAAYYLPDHHADQSFQFVYRRFFYYWKEKHDLLDALMRNGLSMYLVDRMLNYAVQEEQEFRFFLQGPGDDAHECSVFFVGGVMSMVLDWHHTGYCRSVDQMAATLSNLIHP